MNLILPNIHRIPQPQYQHHVELLLPSILTDFRGTATVVLNLELQCREDGRITAAAIAANRLLGQVAKSSGALDSDTSRSTAETATRHARAIHDGQIGLLAS